MNINKKKAYQLIVTFEVISLLGDIIYEGARSVNGWQMAAFLVIGERLAKAVRSPAKDTILSQAAMQVGTGYGIFNASYGLATFFGSIVAGLCLKYSPVAIIGFVGVSQLLAIYFFLKLQSKKYIV